MSDQKKKKVHTLSPMSWFKCVRPYQESCKSLASRPLHDDSAVLPRNRPKARAASGKTATITARFRLRSPSLAKVHATTKLPKQSWQSNAFSSCATFPSSSSKFSSFSSLRNGVKESSVLIFWTRVVAWSSL